MDAAGFIGAALRTHRSRVFMTREQQRAFLGISGEKYDQLWLRLQSMPLPRSGDLFATDLAVVIGELGVTINREHLSEMLHIGP